MPDPIRVPGAIRAAEKERRDQQRRLRGRRVTGTAGPAVVARDKEIRKLVRVGKPVQWVAAEFGLSVSQVYRVAKGEREAA